MAPLPRCCGFTPDRLTMPPCTASPTVGSTAFWFGHEDPLHVSAILQRYSELLPLNQDRTPNSREPPLFIGLVERRVCAEEDLGDCLRTYDVIELYRDDTPLLGKPMKLENCMHVATCWDADGMPRAVETVSPRAAPLSTLAVSYLSCLASSVPCVDDKPLFPRFLSYDRCGLSLDSALSCYARWRHLRQAAADPAAGATPAPPPPPPPAARPLRLEPKRKAKKKRRKEPETNPIYCGFGGGPWDSEDVPMPTLEEEDGPSIDEDSAEWQ